MAKRELAFFGASFLAGVVVAWIIATLISPLFPLGLLVPMDILLGMLCMACAMVVLSRWFYTGE